MESLTIRGEAHRGRPHHHRHPHHDTSFTGDGTGRGHRARPDRFALRIEIPESRIPRDLTGDPHRGPTAERHHVRGHARRDRGPGRRGPWPAPSGLVREIGTAAFQVARVGSAAAQAETQRLLAETRRSLYRILADDIADTPKLDDTDQAVTEPPDDAPAG